MDIIPQDMPRKQCRTCKNFFPATTDFFHSCKNAPYGLRIHCKKCINESHKQDYALKHPRPIDTTIPGFKQCTLCQESKPATLEYFQASNKMKSGLRAQCKECAHATWKKTADLKRSKRPAIPDGQRKCSKCQNLYPATPEYFRRNRACKSGLDFRCKVCTSETSRLHHQAHREQMRQGSKQYYLTHSEQILQKKRVHRRQHPEEISVYGRQYALTHPEQRRAHERNRRARKRKAKGSHTPEQIREQYERQKGKCYYCHKKVKWGEHHVDHTFPISRASGDEPINDISYLVISCKPCNESKGNKYPWEWPAGGRLL